MRAAHTAATSPRAARAGTTVASGTNPSSTTVATGRPRPSPPPIRSRTATWAAKYSAHGAEHGQAHGALFGVERVRQPRVPSPRPPQGAEEHEGLEHATPRRVGGKEAGDLGDGEDEDQIEEQLEGCNPLFGFDLLFTH